MTAKTISFQRYVPLIALGIVLMTLFLIPLKILSFGFVPVGDARRNGQRSQQAGHPQPGGIFGDAKVIAGSTTC